jgi:hypothetical protein
MAKNIRKFVNREFSQTVDLDLLSRLLAPYANELNFDPSALPADEKQRREAIFEFFRAADERFPQKLQDALHCIMVLSDANGVRLLFEQAERFGATLIPPEETEGPGDGRHLTPRHIALRAYLDHRRIFDRALDLSAFLKPPSPMEFVGAEEGVPSRHEDGPTRDAFRQSAADYFATRESSVRYAGTLKKMR